MPLIPNHFIEEVRARLKMSEVAGRTMKLRRAGKDFVSVDDPSLTFSDEKRMFHDFGKSQKSGDIFEFVMWQANCTFEQAVIDLAAMAGLSVPDHGAKPKSRQSPAPGADQGPPSYLSEGPPPDAGPSAQQPAARGSNITATYDYLDAEGALVYQTCRVEWVQDGKKKKTFLQRRPAPKAMGGWLNGLSAGDYIKGKNGDWFVATDDRREQWHGAPVRTVNDGVAHGLFNLPELLNEREEGDDARMVLMPEGEKDCRTLADWGFLAITNSGGAKNWRPEHAELLRDMDVVLLIDNDTAGRMRGQIVGASLRGIAKRVRMLDWRHHWPNCPDKGDVTDWRDLGSGTPDKLYSIIDKLTEWTPVRPESSFSAVPFNEIDKPAREFEWLIKKILTRGETSIWYGQPGCGKSFLLTDAALAVADGADWMGFKVRKGLVLYQAGEGGLGFKKRLRAWRNYHQHQVDKAQPFVLLPQPINLFNGDQDADKLITEAKMWAGYYDIPLELLVIDTFSAASTGADENLSKDVGPVLGRCRRIALELGCHVALVHHTPKGGGSPRGWSGFTGNAENVIEVIRTEGTDTEFGVTGHSVIRDVREFVVRKQKDGEDGFGRKFVLKQVVLGDDADGDPVTSCVVTGVSQNAVTEAPSFVPKGFKVLAPNALSLMRALDMAIKKVGRKPPSDIVVPEGVKCVTVGDWQEIRRETLYAGPGPDDPDGKKLAARIKKQIERTYEGGLWTDKQQLIGKNREWVWRTDTLIHQIDPPRFDNPVVNADMMLAPDEDPGDIADLLSRGSDYYAGR